MPSIRLIPEPVKVYVFFPVDVLLIRYAAITVSQIDNRRDLRTFR